MSTFTYFKNKEINHLYTSLFLKNLATSLISVFVPVYLLTLGYGLVDVALYYLLYYVTVLVVLPVGLYLNSKIGIQRVMALGTFAMMGYFFALHTLEYGTSFIPIAMAFGVSVGLYYAGYHLYLVLFSTKHAEGRQISTIKVIGLLVGTMGAIVGALFIENVSFSALFLVVAGLLALSILPLLLTTRHVRTEPPAISMKSILHADNTEMALAFQANGMINVASTIFWPALIFLTLETVFSVGFIISLSSALVLLFIVVIGVLSDKQRERVFFIGSVLYSSSWITRLLFLTPVGIFMNNLFSTVSNNMVDIPFSKIMYEKAKSNAHAPSFFLFREINLEIGRILVLLLMMATANIYLVFVGAFLATFVYFRFIKTLRPHEVFVH